MKSYNKVGDDNFGRKLKDKLFNMRITEIRQLIRCGFEEEAYKKLLQVQLIKNIGIPQILKVADCFYQLEKYAESLNILEQVESHQSAIEEEDMESSLNLMNLLGLVYKEQGRIEVAEEYWAKCLILNPRYNVALNNLGNIYMHKKNWPEAVKYYWRSKKCR